MKAMPPRLLASATAFLLLTIGPVKAVDVTYNFDQFGFNNGQTTPILNLPPDLGPASFSATFTSAPEADAFLIPTNFYPNHFFSGGYLLENGGHAGNILTITLNMPVDSISVAFATNSFTHDRPYPPYSLLFFSPSGDTSVASVRQPWPDGGFGNDGGILTFSSANPFSTFSLMVNAGGPEFAIDDLNMHVASVPETSPSIFLAYGLAMLFLLRFCRSRRV
jgi:hypothetical protein